MYINFSLAKMLVVELSTLRTMYDDLKISGGANSRLVGYFRVGDFRYPMMRILYSIALKGRT